MLRFLSYNHPFTLGLLLFTAFLFRAPSFHPGFVETDEAYYLTAGERIVEGGVQYVDTWDNKPPVLSWFYAFFVWVFGSFALTAIRIFTCLYLFLGAILLNRIAVDNKLITSFSSLPAFLFLFLSSIPWYTQELNGEILMSVPIIAGVGQVIRVKERSEKNKHYLFLAGILLGISFMIKYQAILIFLGLMAAYLSAHTPRLEEIFSYFMGFFLTLFMLLLFLYFNGALGAYWDIGFLYNLDYLFVGKNPSEEPNIAFNLFQYIQLWGVFFLLALSGIFYYRANYFKHSIRLRKVELIVMVWFVAALLTILIGIGRLYLHYFYLLVPPLTIYATKFFEFNLRKSVQIGVLVVGLFIPMATYGVWFLSAFPQSFGFMDAYISEDGWIAGFRKELNTDHPLSRHIDRDKIKNGVLVLDYAPRVYQWLDVPCATQFTNFSMAYYKFAILPGGQEHDLVSRKWQVPDIYRALEAELPEYFIDNEQLNLFPMLQEKMPVLLQGYQPTEVKSWDRNYKIYSRL